jgi:hypothetical protein
MPKINLSPLKNIVKRQKARKEAMEKEKIKIKDEKDMAGVQGAKEGGRIGLRAGSGPRAGRPVSRPEEQKTREKRLKKKKLLTADEFFKIKDSDKKFRGPQETKGSLGEAINQFREMDDKMVIKMAKGGRAGLKGGGICKRGMNPKARGKNS